MENALNDEPHYGHRAENHAQDTEKAPKDRPPCVHILRHGARDTE